MAIPPSLGPYRTLALPQGIVRFREVGSGRPLVFVHGILVNGELWRRVVPLLSAHYRCILPDLPLGAHLPAMPPNADLSPPGLARIVSDFIAALGLDDVTLIGADTGGAISQLVIANHPERIARLVLTNCDAYRNFLPPLLLPFKWGSFVPGFVPLLAHIFRVVPFSGRRLYALLAHHDPGKEVLVRFFAPLIADSGVRRDATKVLRGVSPRHTLAAARAFPSFHRPVLIVWGDDDLFFSKRDARRLAHDFPNAHLEFIAASRTFVSEDHPEQLASLISAFVPVSESAAA